MEEIQQNQWRLVVYPMICQGFSTIQPVVGYPTGISGCHQQYGHHDLLVSAPAGLPRRRARWSIFASTVCTLHSCQPMFNGKHHKTTLKAAWKKPLDPGTLEIQGGCQCWCMFFPWWKNARVFNVLLSLTKFEKPKVPCCHFTKPKKLEFAFQRCFGRSACFEITKPLFWNS